MKPRGVRFGDWFAQLATDAGIGVDEWPELTLREFSRRVQRRFWN